MTTTTGTTHPASPAGHGHTGQVLVRDDLGPWPSCGLALARPPVPGETTQPIPAWRKRNRSP